MAPTRRLNADEIVQRKQKEVLEKDDTEKQLEKILFGDQASFFDSLNTIADAGDRALTRQESFQDGGDSNAEDDDMQDVADEDLFFLDAGTTDLPDDVMEDLREEQTDQDEEKHARKILWHDSDDERITVSLASNSRLRKLRDTEDDDIVSGLEYIRRLRRQYERLHPTPDWVKYARKKRKHTHEGHESDTDSDVSLDGSPTTSVKPLAELLRSTASFTNQDSKSTSSSGPLRALRLRPEVIDIQRLKDIASSGPASIDTLEFHPLHPLLMTAGPSSTINIYHVSPSSQTPNPLMTSLHIKGTPITTATFALSTNPTPDHTHKHHQKDPPHPPTETKIYLSARRRYFHTWSLTTGTLTKISQPLYQSRSAAANTSLTKSKKNLEIPTTERLILSPDSSYLAIIANTGSSGGVVHLLSATTHQPIAQVRVESLNGIADVAFYRDNSGFVAVGKNGEVSEYNIRERRVTGRWVDEGAVGTTTLALGGEIKDVKSVTRMMEMGNDRYIALGSTSGIVNIYDRREIMGHFAGALSASEEHVYRPKPLRTFDHLTTPISHLNFSGDVAGQLLVMASRWKKNALRLVHLPSCTVYRNWPTDKTPLGRISSVAISPDGGYLAVGNEAGKVRLWQIRD
ncbi:U3 snoRNP protein [Lithohypha guttulata]|uniref:U3 snoRNP protein n=1 Tax=Lithohypha guttulata TaxID=1690604 RepID=UPI002DDF54F7|nr:U3 snoRNP protein [Lithohypha guttulata]